MIYKPYTLGCKDQQQTKEFFFFLDFQYHSTILMYTMILYHIHYHSPLYLVGLPGQVMQSVCTVLPWFQSFLSGCTQKVVLAEHCSVPQPLGYGSTLSPILGLRGPPYPLYYLTFEQRMNLKINNRFIKKPLIC